MPPSPAMLAAASSSDPVRGALWMLGACSLFAAMIAIIRHVSGELHPLEIVFFRNFFGLLAMAPWLTRHGLGALKTEKVPLYGLRAMAGLAAMAAWFYALSRMPLADAVAVSFTAPLFTTIVALPILGEVIRVRRVSALLLGFAGVLIILRPGLKALTTESVLVLFSAAAMGLSMVLVRLLARTESTGTIVTYMVLMLTPLSLIPALFVWQTPSLAALAWLVLLGTAATLGHLCLTRAFASAEATAVAPFDFARLPIIAVIAYLAFDERPDLWTWVGATVIVVSTVYIAHREAVLQRAVTVPSSATPAVPPPGARPGVAPRREGTD